MSNVVCTILAGPTVAVPLPNNLMETVKQIEITHNDEQRSGFQITFTAGRGSLLSRINYPVLSSLQLQPFNRLIVLVTINFIPRMLIDGIITHVQLDPADDPGRGTVVITGEDVSVMMDREEKIVEHPAQNDYVIANKIIATYAQYSIVPQVIPPPTLDAPIPTDRTPVQYGSDLEFLQHIADRYDYVFYVAPGIVPLVNTGYWGPRNRVGLLQKALSVNMGSNSNVNSIQFQHDALKAAVYSGHLQDRNTASAMPVQTFTSTRVPLSRQGAANTKVRKSLLKDTPGLSYQLAQAKAQARTEASRKQVVVAQGDIDIGRYGDILQARGLIGLRGVGESYDGQYYVKEVTHILKPGQYQQRFTLTRDGTGTTIPVVRP